MHRQGVAPGIGVPAGVNEIESFSPNARASQLSWMAVSFTLMVSHCCTAVEGPPVGADHRRLDRGQPVDLGHRDRGADAERGPEPRAVWPSVVAGAMTGRATTWELLLVDDDSDDDTLVVSARDAVP